MPPERSYSSKRIQPLSDTQKRAIRDYGIWTVLYCSTFIVLSQPENRKDGILRF
jgi:hypothetical protein